MKISIIIPTFNEEKSIGLCLQSLAQQTIAHDAEIIVVDDGSTDLTRDKVKEATKTFKNFSFLFQKHQGPGAARNLGAIKAQGKILVFVDADMQFSPDFIEKLIAPIDGKNIIGTFSTDEFLLNKDNVLARCWNLNLGRQPLKMEPKDFSASNRGVVAKLKQRYKLAEGGSVESRQKGTGHVFRAILKEKFDSVGGFDTNVGYTDDWSISNKLKILAAASPGAIYFHRNPETLTEVWAQARWFGKNEFLTRNFIRKVFNMFRYNPVTGFLGGIYGWFKFNEPTFVVFKVIFDTAVFVSVLLSFINEPKSK